MLILECIFEPVIIIVCRQNSTAKTPSLTTVTQLKSINTEAAICLEICESLWDTNVTFRSLHHLHYSPPNSSPSFSSPSFSRSAISTPAILSVIFQSWKFQSPRPTTCFESAAYLAANNPEQSLTSTSSTTAVAAHVWLRSFWLTTSLNDVSSRSTEMPPFGRRNTTSY